MRLKIAARKSDLARLQAYMVGDALKKQFPDIEIEYRFRTSLGDQNQNDPLWKMPTQGVFTKDFRDDLVRDKIDMVVHSWKDLPTQIDEETMLAATLLRADHRDLLLVKKDAIERVKSNRSLRLLSSSPRRMYNLQGFLKQAFPGGVDEIDFSLVRGNIQTRLDKLLGSDADGLIVAKAAIDRLGAADQFNQANDSFGESAKIIRARIAQCNWMVLPASHNPPAAAQGALVVEISRKRTDLIDILAQINCQKTFDDVSQEREILASHGGGCHQKIGVWVDNRAEGKVISIRGKTDAGETLNKFSLVPSNDIPKNIPASQIMPSKKLGELFSRRAVPMTDEVASSISKSDAVLLASPRVPEEYLDKIGNKVVWASGVASWFKFAAKGIWVHGADDNLGANENRRLELLIGDNQKWLTLTHTQSPAKDALPTYELVPSANSVNLGGAQYFYWRSGSAFKRAIQLDPNIKNGMHACGLGRTLAIISDILGDEARVYPFVSEEDWLSQIS